MKTLQLTIAQQHSTMHSIGNNLQSDILKQIREINPTSVMVITSEIIQPLCAQPIIAKLKQANIKTGISLLPDGEDAKDMMHVMQTIHSMLQQNVDRKSIILAIGGGTVSDVSGYIASIYKRGIPWISCPTTLLAQVDAAIGGKNAVNIAGVKNIAGTFYLPLHVFADITLLHSLPDEELSSGMAEVIKYAVTFDPQLLNLLESESLATITPHMAKIVHRSIELKIRVVEKDPFEQTGIRHILNFGHTLGHAIESVTNLGTYSHGQAVAIGMIAAAKISEKMDYATNQDVKRIYDVIEKYELPVNVKIPHDQLIDRIHHDKKTIGNKTKWVLLNGIGKTVTNIDVPEEIIRDVLREMH